MEPSPPRYQLKGLSRYELLVKIGSGGTASVYIGRVTGSAGFSRLVAVKRAHPHLIDDPAAQKMLVTEARFASRVNHANVVSVQDVEHTEEELLLVMDYVEGASLAELLEGGARMGNPMPSRIAVRIALDSCAGLAAVHELEGDDGRPLGFLHRDVSPQNILIGVDGSTRITDFGLARRLSDGLGVTGVVKGKLAYLAPETIDHAVFSVQSDIFALGVVVWEAVARRRLFRGSSEADTVRRVGLVEAPKLSRVVPALGTHLDAVVAKALEKAADLRWSTVREMSGVLEAIARKQDLIATSTEVSAYVRAVVGDALRKRREVIRTFDGATTTTNAERVVVPPLLSTTQTASIVYPNGVPPVSSAPHHVALSTPELTPTLPRMPQRGAAPRVEHEIEDPVTEVREDLRAAPVTGRARREESAEEAVTTVLEAVRIRPSPRMIDRSSNAALRAPAAPVFTPAPAPVFTPAPAPVFTPPGAPVFTPPLDARAPRSTTPAPATVRSNSGDTTAAAGSLDFDEIRSPWRRRNAKVTVVVALAAAVVTAMIVAALWEPSGPAAAPGGTPSAMPARP